MRRPLPGGMPQPSAAGPRPDRRDTGPATLARRLRGRDDSFLRELLRFLQRRHLAFSVSCWYCRDLRDLVRVLAGQIFQIAPILARPPGQPNAYPKVGPIVITEIMYNPVTGNQEQEYVELYNAAQDPVALFDAEGTPWAFTDGIAFTFPPGITMPADGRLLVVKDPALFALTYPNVPGDVQVLGPYEGRLSNAGEKLELSMPGDVDALGVQQYIRIDRVNYDDEAPWPSQPDGGGSSLTRLHLLDYGNDVINWHAASPTPGT